MAGRKAYDVDVRRLGELESKMRAAGRTDEEIANSLHQARRDLGIKYKNLTPPDLLEQIYARNRAKYGDPLGPSIEWLRARGKSWTDIIESAKRTGGKDLGF